MGEDERQADDRARYIASLEEQVAYLREQLDKEREANGENRRLLAAAVEALAPQLEVSTEQREAAEADPDTSSGAVLQPGGGDPGREVRWWRRSWWQIVLAISLPGLLYSFRVLVPLNILPALTLTEVAVLGPLPGGIWVGLVGSLRSLRGYI